MSMNLRERIVRAVEGGGSIREAARRSAVGHCWRRMKAICAGCSTPDAPPNAPTISATAAMAPSNMEVRLYQLRDVEIVLLPRPLVNASLPHPITVR
jgi:hypothetical protein